VKLRALSASPAVWLIGIFVILVGVKCYWVFNSTGPSIFNDEVLYKDFARRIYNGRPYGPDAHYPPLYPLSLSLAFASKEHWYEWMLFINAILSSSIIFPVYLIGKRMLGGEMLFVPVIMVALLPFHAVFPSLVMSENLFLTLFLFAVYLSLICEERNWLFGALVGACSAMAYLTKYLFLPSIPVLIGLWWIIPLLDTDRKGRSIRQRLQLPGLAAVMTGFLALFLPWLLYAHYSGLSIVRDAMGLDVVGAYSKAFAEAEIRFSGARADIPNLESLTFWATAYGSYTVLVLAPLLSTLCLYVRLWLSNKEEIPFREKLFTFSLIVFSIGYVVLAVQHSWGSEENYPEPRYLVGRYLMHLTPLYLIAAVMALCRIRNYIHSMSMAVVVCASVLSAILVYVAQHVLYEQTVWKSHSWFAGSTFNSPDSFVFRKYIAFQAVLVILAAIGVGFIAARMNKTFARRYMLPFAITVLILFQLGAFVMICKKTMIHGGWPLHGRLLAPVFRFDLKNGDESIALKYDIPDLSDRVLLWSLYFWLEQGAESKIKVTAMSERSGETSPTVKQYTLSTVCSSDVYARSYTVDGTRYCLYKSRNRSGVSD
jgi:hypothetical protein